MGPQVSTKSKLENWADNCHNALCVFVTDYTTDILPNENVAQKHNVIFNIFLLGALK